MHPGMLAWWKARQSGSDCCSGAECGPPGGGGGHRGWHGHGGHGHGDHGGWEAGGADDGDMGGGSFGVRRPLRFLAFKLGLDERQVAELAKVLADLKTERAQAAVDGRRTVGAFADALGSDTFDAAKAGEGAALRTTSAERLSAAVLKALERIHALLDTEQRTRLAYLIRTGTLQI